MLFDILMGKLQDLVLQCSPKKTIYLNVDEKDLCLLCMDFEPSDLMFSSIHALIGNRKEYANYELFYCFQRDSKALAAFLPKDLSFPEGRYVYDGPEGRFVASIQFGYFSLFSVKNNATYIWLCPDMHSLDGFISHPFHMEFSWWAMRNNLTFLHSACIGIDGKGVLISGAGGSGKSTLALSCLLTGMQLLSDDYLLIKQGEQLEAIRLYSTAYLTEEILSQLPDLKKQVYWTNDIRKKSLLDLQFFESLIINKLPLSAIVIPHIAHAETPRIEANADMRKLIPLLSSTSYQNRELKNKNVFHGMMQLLKRLPAFHFTLTDDIYRNATYLKTWLEEL